MNDKYSAHSSGMTTISNAGLLVEAAGKNIVPTIVCDVR